MVGVTCAEEADQDIAVDELRHGSAADGDREALAALRSAKHITDVVAQLARGIPGTVPDV